MKHASALRAGFAVAAVATSGSILFACGEGPSEPPLGPGDLYIRLIAPPGAERAEGAAVFETQDRGIVGIETQSGQVIYWRAGASTRIVVLLDEPGEIEFTMNVRDRRSAARPQVVEVADSNNVLRGDWWRYSVSLSW